MKRIYSLLWSTMFILSYSCDDKTNPRVKTDNSTSLLFTLIDPEESGINFSNDLPFSQEFNVYTYRNYYNGGGVSLGDINNDGLPDIYLTSNANSNKLFLNKGNFKFEDITVNSGVAGSKGWSTGVTMVDINGDGWLDIYVCNSGDIKGDNKQNELFINNGDLTFTERAIEFGLADQGFSTHASFFDFDKDGDLDVYLLNNSYQAIGSFNLRKNERPKRDAMGGDKLMENINGKFVDISEKAGIYGSIIGFGLGVTIGDTNKDGWEDIYVSNDFFERDYLYINQKDGTFKEQLTEQMNSVSGASMGADLADIDNDGNNEIFVTEMLPNDYQRLKTVTTFEDWNKYQYNVKNGYYHQFTRNMLQKNNGNGTFSEVGRFSGVEASDWSWGALFFDMDNDGLKDLFIANGVYQDLTDQDYLQYISNEEIAKSIITGNQIDYKKLIEIIPSNKVPNQAYRNNGNLDFELYETSGLLEPSFSNGSAYGDLDNDGDLDLVVNNVNSPLFLYRNNASQLNGNNFLKIALHGSAQNTQAIGASIEVYLKNDTLFYEQQPVRGFQSSMDPVATIGTGKEVPTAVRIIWPNGKTSLLQNPAVNTTLSFNQSDATENYDFSGKTEKALFTRDRKQFPVKHIESNFVDFNRDRLLNAMMSTEGPKLTAGDVNQDGFTDIYFGSAKNNKPYLLLGNENGFELSNQPDFEHTIAAEDGESLFFDANGDGFLDLYVCSGGVEYNQFSSNYKDRLYLNNGKGQMVLNEQILPVEGSFHSTSTVCAADIDKDGDLDLLVGERVIPGKYGLQGTGFLLENDGKGNFTNITEQKAPELLKIGMITDASFVDIDNDGQQDIIVVGEFMEVTMLKNSHGSFNKIKLSQNEALKGWWNVVETTDINNDGKLDLILGNHGLNSRFRADQKHPIKLYVNDFDNNGKIDPIMTFTANDGKDYPYALRHDLIDQIKSLKKKFPNYESFKNATIEDMFNSEQIKNSIILETDNLSTTVLLNKGNFEFESIEIPFVAQLSPVYAICPKDFDGDGDTDILLGGNLYSAKPEVGRYDASYGLFLENLGKNKFKSHANNNGFQVQGEIRSITPIASSKKILVAVNNDSLVQFSYDK